MSFFDEDYFAAKKLPEQEYVFIFHRNINAQRLTKFFSQMAVRRTETILYVFICVICETFVSIVTNYSLLPRRNLHRKIRRLH